ncbi:hypothetical protein GP486_002898, partial [Trichoglossum hirsutum]
MAGKAPRDTPIPIPTLAPEQSLLLLFDTEKGDTEGVEGEAAAEDVAEDEAADPMILAMWTPSARSQQEILNWPQQKPPSLHWTIITSV